MHILPDNYENLGILGSGGHSKCIIDIIKNKYINFPTRMDKSVPKILMYDDDPEKQNNTFYGEIVDGRIKDMNYKASFLICAIGNNRVRKTITENVENRLRIKSPWWVNIVGKNTTVSPSAFIDEGTVVFNNVNIGPSVMIGRQCIINNCANVDHDCRIDNYVHIAPNATLCGGVIIGEGTLIGAGAVIIPGIKIGSWLTIKAGSMVKRDILTQEDLLEYYKK